MRIKVILLVMFGLSSPLQAHLYEQTNIGTLSGNTVVNRSRSEQCLMNAAQKAHIRFLRDMLALDAQSFIQSFASIDIEQISNSRTQVILTLLKLEYLISEEESLTDLSRNDRCNNLLEQIEQIRSSMIAPSGVWDEKPFLQAVETFRELPLP